MKELPKSRMIVSVVVAVLVSSPAWATMLVPFMQPTAGTVNTANQNFTFGFTFTVGTKPVVIGGLGVWDNNPSDGLANSHDVGVWNGAGALVLSATVPQGMAGDLIDGFRYYILPTSYTLQAGETYTLGAFYVTNDADSFRQPAVPVYDTSAVAAGTLGSVYNYGPASLSEPTQNFNLGKVYDGPNFLEVIPEPSTILLFGLGGALLWFQRRRSR